MTQVGQDSLGTRSTMTVGGKDVAYYSLKKAGEKLGDISGATRMVLDAIAAAKG